MLVDLGTMVIINISLVTEMLYREWNVYAKYLLLVLIHILCLWSHIPHQYALSLLHIRDPFSRLRQSPYGESYCKAKDAHSFMARDPTSNYFRDPCLISSWYFSFGFWFWTLSVITTFHGCVSKSHISKRWIIKSSL